MRLEITPAKISGNLLILISFFFFGCMSPQKTREIVINTDFDISADDSKVLFACYLAKNKGISIYEMSFKDSVPKLIISCDEKNSYYHPRYLKGGKEIAFLKINKKNFGDRTICVAKSDGSNLRELTAGNEIIENIVVSQYYDSVLIYTRAGEISKGSPLGRTQPHDYNIYSINYRTDVIRQISIFKGIYNMNKLSEVDSNLFVVGMAPNGMFFLRRDEPDRRFSFVPKDNPRGDSTLYYSPSYSKKWNCIGFTAPYELYTMDLKTNKSKREFRNDEGSIDGFCLFNTKKKILFLREYDTQFLVKDLETGGMEVIKVKF